MGSCSSQHVPEAQRGEEVRLVTGRLRPGRVMRLLGQKALKPPRGGGGWWHCCRQGVALWLCVPVQTPVYLACLLGSVEDSVGVCKQCVVLGTGQ